MSVEHWQCRARVACHDNNERTKSGRAPYEVFEEVSKPSASITAALCVLAVGFLKGVNATCRDVYPAYRQVRCDSEREHLPLIELPREGGLCLGSTLTDDQSMVDLLMS